MMISGIYKIKNCITEDCYIGSAVDIKRRWRFHKSKLNKNDHVNKHLQNSWNKHTETNFKFEVIENCLIEDLITREQFYIDALKPSYNKRIIAQSNLGFKMSEETRNLMSELQTHRQSSDSFKKEMSEKIKNSKSHNDYLVRYKQDIEINGLRIDSSRIVIQKNLEGIEIKEHINIKLAHEAIGKFDVKGGGNISLCCLGKRPTAYGFIWSYKNN